MTTFKELGVADEFIKALKENNIQTPTEIQEKAIPFLMETGGDFIGQAQTGTGKTAAFGLPLLHQVNPDDNRIQALVLAPTRELCQQIAKQLFRYTKYSAKIFTEAVYGGEKIDKQIASLKRPTQIVVATPGRLIDLLERRAISLQHVQTLVLDEADEMLSMGFRDELNSILDRTNGKWDIWLFSATMSKDINRIIKTYMDREALHIHVDEASKVNDGIVHSSIPCSKKNKVEILVNFLEEYEDAQGIIFCNTRRRTELLARELAEEDFLVDFIHGELSQLVRDKVMRKFKKKTINILVATDVSARGIDINNLAYVVHYELPDQIDYYTHRSGRTARAGKKGLSLCLIGPEEMEQLEELEKSLGIEFQTYGDSSFNQ